MSKGSMGRKVAAIAVGAAAAAAGVAAVRAARRGPVVIHVEPDPDSWRLRVEGDRKASKVFATKREAVSAGRELAHRRLPSELVIHRADGSEQDRHSYEG